MFDIFVAIPEAREASKHLPCIIYLLRHKIPAQTDQYSLHSCPKCVFLGAEPIFRNPTF